MLGHFLIVAGLLVVSIVLTLAFMACAGSLHSESKVGEQAFFGVTVFLFLWALFSTLELVKLVLGIAVTNTELHQLPGADERDQQTW